MEESYENTSPSRRSSIWKHNKRRSTNDTENSANETSDKCPNQNTNKSKWKSLFHIFTKFTNNSSTSRKSRRESIPKSSNEMDANAESKKMPQEKICETDQQLIMAINLPDDVKGKDVKVSIELKALGKLTSSDRDTAAKSSISGSSLLVKNSTPDYSVYAGNIKVPSSTTIEHVSKMPLYFLSTQELERNEQKVETIIQPMTNNLPTDMDKNMLIDEIDLKVNFENVANRKVYKSPSLNCSFIYGSNSDKDNKILVNPSEIVNEVATKCHGELSKLVVSEILNEVLNRVHRYSTQKASDLIDNFNKEIDVQKTLLLEDESPVLSSVVTQVSSQAFLTPIKRSEHSPPAIATKTKTKTTNPNVDLHLKTSEETLYATSNTTSNLESKTPSMLYLQVPNNTPNSVVPKYLIKYDNTGSANNDHLVNSELCNYAETQVKFVSVIPENWTTKRAIQEDLRADIDKTLELLETAKNKLICYIDEPLKLLNCENTSAGDIKITNRNFNNGSGKMCDLIPIEMMVGSIDKFPQRKPDLELEDKNNNQQFFLGMSQKEEEDLCARLSSTTLMESKIEANAQFLDILDEKYETPTDDIFQDRYFYNGHFTEPLKKKLSPNIVKNDIDIMMKELLHETNLMKESIIQKLNSDNDLEDIGLIMDYLLERVEKLSDSNSEPRNVNVLIPPPNSCTVNPVYYCLVQDSLLPTTNDKILSSQSSNLIEPLNAVFGKFNGKFNGKLNQLTKDNNHWTRFGNQFRSNQSTISFRHLGHCDTKFAPMKSTEGLLDKLERGAAFIADVYKEIFYGLQTFIDLAHVKNNSKGNNLMVPLNLNNDSQPVVKKSGKILVFEPKNVDPPKERTSFVEKVEKVINPTEEKKPKEKTKNNKILKHKEDSVCKKFTGCDAFQAYSIKVSLFPIGNTNQRSCKSPEKTCVKSDTKSDTKSDIKSDTKSDTKSDNASHGSETNDVQNANQSDLDIAESTGLLLLDSSGILQNQNFASEQTFVDVMYDFDVGTTNYEAVADVPHAFDSSQEMVQYTKNLNVLQEKMRPQNVSTISAASSSDSDVTVVKALSSRLLETKESKSKTAKVARITNSQDDTASSLSSRLISTTPRDTNYDADREDYDLNLAVKTHFVRSKQELNGPEEIALIERNVSDNYLLCMRDQSWPDAKNRKKASSVPLFLYDSSIESITEPSVSIESSLPGTPDDFAKFNRNE